ncbi:MAG: acetate kinase [Candidatus Peregrinibacteria bacterium]|nr:acetate kinase [Candidatus Peregrinibacteria bacterium]MDZ4244775.1 acetate kinase [Candidatus Gracilibacteria bacterium]
MAKVNHILVLNCGSSSIKIIVFEKQKNAYKEVYTLYIERIKNHTRSLKKFFKQFKKSHAEIFENIDKMGHRVVHGGEKYTKPLKVTDKVLKELERLTPLAPLHNPANIAGIKASQKLLPHITNYAVFDTAYYSTLPEKAYLYALPYELYKKHGIRRYGFHGTSHQYVTEEAQRFLKKKNQKIISCHLGNGASVTASIDGKAIDTSMGFTPLEGIPMGTRCGDIDPAIIFYLAKNTKGVFTKTKLEKIHSMLEHESGLKGVSGISKDMRDLRDAFFKTKGKKHTDAKRALDLYCYRIAKYIGGYAASMNGLDTIIFTATIGEKANYIRKWVCEYLDDVGVKLDTRKNNACTNPKDTKQISDKKSKVKVLVIPTNEALQIAKQA